MLLLVVTTPIYLRILGEDRFGLYMLLVAVVAPFEVLNAGVAQATVKHLAAWLPEGRLAESAAMMRIGLMFNWAAGAVAVLGLWAASPWLARSVFQISEALQPDAITSFRVAGPLWLTIQITGSLGAVVAAEQNFRLISIVQIIRSIFTYLGGIPVLLFFGTVASLQAWSILTFVPILVLWGSVVWRRLGATAILPGFDRTAFERSFGFSGWQMLNAISSAIVQQADRVLLGAMLGTAAVGAYGIAASIQQRSVALIWSGFATLFPAVSKNSESSPEKAEIDLLQKGNILSLLACVAYTVGFWFAGPFCVVWLGAGQDFETVAYLLQILFLVAILSIPSAQMVQYLLGHGLTRLIFFGNISMAATIAVSSYFLILRFGVSGAAIGAFAGLLISRLPLHIWVTWKHMASGSSAASRLWSIYCIPVVFVVVLISSSIALRWGFGKPDPTKINALLSTGSFLTSFSLAIIVSYFGGAKTVFNHLWQQLKILSRKFYGLS